MTGSKAIPNRIIALLVLLTVVTCGLSLPKASAMVEVYMDYQAEQGPASDWLPIPGGVPQGHEVTTSQWDAVIGANQYKYVERRGGSAADDPKGSVDIYVSDHPFRMYATRDLDATYKPHYQYLVASVSNQIVKVYSTLGDVEYGYSYTFSGTKEIRNAAYEFPYYVINKSLSTPVIPTWRLTTPWGQGDDVVISSEQLNSAADEILMSFEVEDAAYMAIAVDGQDGLEYIDWDADAIFEKEMPNAGASTYFVDVTAALKSIKSRLGLGNHTLYMMFYNVEDWNNPEEVDPTLIDVMGFKVVGTNGEVPPEGGYPDARLPTAPEPPDQAWDVVGWLKYIFDWILYLFNIVGYMLGRFGEMITTGFGQITGLTNALKMYFSWLPPEITGLLVMGLVASILVSIIRR